MSKQTQIHTFTSKEDAYAKLCQLDPTYKKRDMVRLFSTQPVTNPMIRASFEYEAFSTFTPQLFEVNDILLMIEKQDKKSLQSVNPLCFPTYPVFNEKEKQFLIDFLSDVQLSYLLPKFFSHFSEKELTYLKERLEKESPEAMQYRTCFFNVGDVRHLFFIRLKSMDEYLEGTIDYRRRDNIATGVSYDVSFDLSSMESITRNELCRYLSVNPPVIRKRGTQTSPFALKLEEIRVGKNRKDVRYDVRQFEDLLMSCYIPNDRGEKPEKIPERLYKFEDLLILYGFSPTNSSGLYTMKYVQSLQDTQSIISYYKLSDKVYRYSKEDFKRGMEDYLLREIDTTNCSFVEIHEEDQLKNYYTKEDIFARLFRPNSRMSFLPAMIAELKPTIIRRNGMVIDTHYRYHVQDVNRMLNRAYGYWKNGHKVRNMKPELDIRTVNLATTSDLYSYLVNECGYTKSSRWLQKEVKTKTEKGQLPFFNILLWADDEDCSRFSRYLIEESHFPLIASSF